MLTLNTSINAKFINSGIKFQRVGAPMEDGSGNKVHGVLYGYVRVNTWVVISYMLTHRQLEMDGCILYTIVIALVLKHQATSINSGD